MKGSYLISEKRNIIKSSAKQKQSTEIRFFGTLRYRKSSKWALNLYSHWWPPRKSATSSIRTGAQSHYSLGVHGSRGIRTFSSSINDSKDRNLGSLVKNSLWVSGTTLLFVRHRFAVQSVLFAVTLIPQGQQVVNHKPRKLFKIKLFRPQHPKNLPGLVMLASYYRRLGLWRVWFGY